MDLQNLPHPFKAVISGLPFDMTPAQIAFFLFREAAPQGVTWSWRPLLGLAEFSIVNVDQMDETKRQERELERIGLCRLLMRANGAYLRGRQLKLHICTAECAADALVSIMCPLLEVTRPTVRPVTSTE